MTRKLGQASWRYIVKHPLRWWTYRQMTRWASRGAEAISEIEIIEVYDWKLDRTIKPTPYGVAMMVIEAAHPRMAKR